MPTAPEASASAGSGDSVIGWKLDPQQRAELLLMFPPAYPQAVADHVTLRSRAAADAALPDERDCEIVGRADDGRGVEAMVVRIMGTTGRPDGSIYHITWSLADGRRAKESNDVIAALGWTPLDLPVPVALTPARFR
ncbi:MAG TPA: hypothetical protein VGO55_03675 [Allosphingosinicella sp.]|jgi:hypothetical protein|nr:hypothetical protein [Allosphingosinicella sp.]